MQITIKSTRIIKEDQRKDGTPYKWCSVMAEDGSEKGTEYTTFDAGVLKLNPGAVIDIGDLVTKSGKLSFKKIVNIISEGTAQESPGPRSNDGGYKKDIEGLKVEYALRARENAIKNASIEAQTAYNGGISLIEIIDKMTQNEQEKYKPLVDAAIAWGLKKLTETDLKEQLANMPHIGAKPSKDKDEVKEKKPPGTPSAQIFNNVGEFFTACAKAGITRKAVLEHLRCKEADIPKIDTATAWQVIYEELIKPSENLFGEKGEAKEQATATS